MMTAIDYKTRATRQRGLSLIELLLTLTLTLILFGTGIPAFHQWLQKTSEEATFKYLFHLMVYTRTEAIKANDYFTLCPTLNERSCGGPWNGKIMVFRDMNKNEKLDTGEWLAKLFSLPDSTPCIHWNRPKRQYVQFKPTGMINGTAGRFRFCENHESAIKKELIVSFNGRTALKNWH